MDSKRIDLANFGSGLSHEGTIQLVRESVTNFSWLLNDWTLLFERYSQGVSSDFFLLEGLDKCACQFSLNPGNLKNPFAIEFSNTHHFQAIKILIDINGKPQFEGCYSRPVPTILHLSGVDVKIDSLFRGDDSLLIKVCFFITKTRTSEILPCQKPLSNISIMKDMYESETLCDVTFVFNDEEELSAHKAVLAVQSEVFQSMFLTEMKEKDSSRVEIVDVTAEVFDQFLKYLYIREIDDLENIAVELLVVADKYQVSDLKEFCENYMLKNLHDKNIVQYLIVANRIGSTELQNKALGALKKNANAWIEALASENLESFKILKQIMFNDPPKKV